MRILGLIPARGGSKGIPRKNIRLLWDKPVLQHTAEAALASQRLTRVVLSTEDEEIAEVGRRCGLDVPFMRPKDLAQDTTPTLPVIQHALQVLESRGDSFDAVCLLQPTNPLRTAQHIDGCIELLEATGADSVITVLPVPAEHNPHWVFFRRSNGTLYLSTGEKSPIPRRQELPPAFHRDGTVYVTRREVILNHNSLLGEYIVGYELDLAQSINLDSLDDWAVAERLRD